MIMYLTDANTGYCAINFNFNSDNSENMIVVYCLLERKTTSMYETMFNCS